MTEKRLPRFKCAVCDVLWNGDPECWNCGTDIEDCAYPTVDGTMLAYAVLPTAFVPGQEW